LKASSLIELHKQYDLLEFIYKKCFKTLANIKEIKPYEKQMGE
jgi:hypothetical protein